MALKNIVFVILLFTPVILTSQGQSLNQTDASGKKQGHWIKNYPNGNTMYEGTFSDDMPTGELKRFYEDNKLKSVLLFSDNGQEADAILYYRNGYVASKGKYINQMKEGLWRYYSTLNSGMLISEETFRLNKRNGESRRYYPDSTVAEVINYKDDLMQGEFLKFYPEGRLLLKSNYASGKLDGRFEAFFSDGRPEAAGTYRNNLKEGEWIIYNRDGSVRFRTIYTSGKPDNALIDIYETNYIDSLEKHRVEIPDPEKTGERW